VAAGIVGSITEKHQYRSRNAHAQLVGILQKAPTIRLASTRNSYMPCFVVFNVFGDFYVIFSDFYLYFQHLREDEL